MLYDGSIMCGLNAVLINTINSRVRNDRYWKHSNHSTIDNDATDLNDNQITDDNVTDIDNYSTNHVTQTYH